MSIEGVSCSGDSYASDRDGASVSERDLSHLFPDCSALLVSRDARLGDREFEGGVRGGGRLEWGDPKGPKISAYTEGTYRDNRGNDARIGVEHNTEGKGSAYVDGGHTFGNRNERGYNE